MALTRITSIPVSYLDPALLLEQVNELKAENGELRAQLISIVERKEGRSPGINQSECRNCQQFSSENIRLKRELTMAKGSPSNSDHLELNVHNKFIVKF